MYVRENLGAAFPKRTINGWKATLRIAFTRNYFNMQIRKCEGELCFDVVAEVGYADVFFKLMAACEIRVLLTALHRARATRRGARLFQATDK